MHQVKKGRIILSKADYDRIENEAVNLVEDLGFTEFPVDCFEVAKLLNIRMEKYSEVKAEYREMLISKYEDGYSVLLNKSEYVIYYNDEKPKERIKFTIWHEIGHIQLGHFDEEKIVKDEMVMEAECNHFAQFIMVPLCFLDKIKLESLQDIIDTFHVSFEFAENMFYKYFNVRQYPTVMAKIRNHRMLSVLAFDYEEGCMNVIY